jgi:ubiquinone/menaquinone biosynthesis C-methylase UbiE
MKIDLGGGRTPKAGYTNIDNNLDHADITVDLDKVGTGEARLPFDDNSIEAVYSSHCLEHVRYLNGVWKEIVRVCPVGAPVEIRVPHWASDMAHCGGHVHAIGETWIKQMCEYFVYDHFPQNECVKRLRLDRIRYEPSEYFDEAVPLFPLMSREQIMRYVQGTCHEIHYLMTVVFNY